MQRIGAMRALALLCAAFSCQAAVTRLSDDCIAEETVVSASLWPSNYLLVGDSEPTPEGDISVHAIGFDVVYKDNLKIVNDSLAGEVYVLYQCGTEPPQAADIPDGAKVFQIPLTSVSVADTVAFGFLNELGLDDRSHSVSPYVTDACGQKLLSCNRTADGMIDYNNATAVDEALDGQVDAVFTSFFGAPSPSPLAISVPSIADPGPLNRAEWIKFVALFFNREAAASEMYNRTVEQYNALAALTDDVEERPVVAWVNHYLYGTEESFQVSFADYKLQYVQDAGGASLDYDELLSTPGVTASPWSPSNLEFAWYDANGTTFASKAEAAAAFQDVLAGVDVVIDETYALDPNGYDLGSFLFEYGLEDAEVAEFPFLSNASVFRLDGRISETGGMDIFESGVVHPDLYLRDMLRATHPELVENPAAFTFLRNIAAGEEPIVLTAAACSAVTTCNQQPQVICPFVAFCDDGEAVELVDEEDGCNYAPCREF